MRETWVRSLGQEDPPGEGKWQPTPVLLPGESQGGRSLVGYSPWGGKESDTTERLSFPFLFLFMCIFACILSLFSRVRLFATPWTVAHQAPLSMGFSRQEYWSGLPYIHIYFISDTFAKLMC